MKILKNFNEYVDILFEDVSSIGDGIGNVVSAQPSSLPGQTIGADWAENGGTIGSGDVSTPYNTGIKKTVFTKSDMGINHGPMTGKKKRNKKLNLKELKKSFDIKYNSENDTVSKSKPKKVMNFNDFLKDDILNIKNN